MNKQRTWTNENVYWLANAKVDDKENRGNEETGFLKKI